MRNSLDEMVVSVINGRQEGIDCFAYHLDVLEKFTKDFKRRNLTL